MYLQKQPFDSADSCLALDQTLTDCSKDVGETEVIHGVKGEEVVEKLLLLIITAEEGVTFVQFSEREKWIVSEICTNNTTDIRGLVLFL